jgi:hypothetical protein
MLNLDLYLHSAGLIAPAADVPLDAANKKLAAEPDYTPWIPPMQLRRTSKVVRMGIGAARLCIDASGIKQPDAISIGTAMGCLQDTEVFLSKMVAQDEKMLTPTAFIQSTHNTVGGQIALLMGCFGHNMTFVHRGHSFEHAVVNTKLYLQQHTGQTVLAGGIDELTPSSHILMQRKGFYKSDYNQKGVIAGEGAAFFALNEHPDGAIFKVKKLHLFSTHDPARALAEATRFLEQESVSALRIQVALLGNCGDDRDTTFYTPLNTLLPSERTAGFKNLCGEYATAIAYALAMLAVGYRDGHFADGFLPGVIPAAGNLLLVNHFCDDYAIWLLEAGAPV